MASMSFSGALIPYTPREGREIVLRHNNAIVVHDPSSRRLELHALPAPPTGPSPPSAPASASSASAGGADHHQTDDAAFCPTCRRPLHPQNHELPAGPPSESMDGARTGAVASYVDPEYFRMLQAAAAIAAASSTRRRVTGGGVSSARRQQHARGPGGSPVRRLMDSAPPPDRVVGGEDSAVVDEEEGEREGEDSAIAEADDDVTGGRVVYTASDYEDGDRLDHAAADDQGVDSGAEFHSSSPAPVSDSNEGSRIRREAFTPGYFKRFFVTERELGRGGKGVVLLVRHEISNCPLGLFACKRVPVGDDHKWLEKVLVEVTLLAKLSHPNLVSYRHVWLETVKMNQFSPPVACAFILQQYCNGGDLLRYVVGDGPKEATKEELKARMRRKSKGQAERPLETFPAPRKLHPEEIYSLFKDITSGLQYLHASNYIHRDLKPSNCLLHREGGKTTCLISDFGEVQRQNVARNSSGSTGTISYCAPEVLQQDSTGRYGNFTTKSDIFSLGMILYFLCFGRLPYQSANMVQEELEDVDQLRAEIKDWKGFQDERRERPELPSKLYNLLKKMLAIDPSERPSASEVLAMMKNESALDGLSYGFSNRRIQNLDSPVPPGTPVPDPVKHSVSQEDLSRSPAAGQAQRHPLPSPHHRRHPTHSHTSSATASGSMATSTAMTISRSQDRYPFPSVTSAPNSRSPTHSPTRQLSPERRGDVSPHRHHHNHHGTPTLKPSPPPALLMPPPPPSLLIRVARTLYLTARHPGTAVTARTALFVLKMWNFAGACAPFAVAPSSIFVFLAVILPAAADLGVPAVLPPSTWSLRVSLALLALHYAVLAAASRAGWLCASPAVPRPVDSWQREWR